MSDRQIVVRSMHDLGAAAWFGGALMGAVGLNGAAANITNPRERSRIAATGWARWAPFNAAAIGVHSIGGLGLLIENRDRIKHQNGELANTIAKTGLSAVAAAVTLYSGILGAKVAKAGQVPVEGATEPAPATPPEVAKAQNQLQWMQWLTPVLTGAIIVLGADQGEKQRPLQLVRGLLAA